MKNSHSFSGLWRAKAWLAGLCLLCCQVLPAQKLVFSPADNRQELNEEQIRNIVQLPDGRLVIITESVVNLFDGAAFRNIAIEGEHTLPLPGYKGFHHSYIENDRLWLKVMGKLTLIDLRRETGDTHPEKLLQQLGIHEAPADFFVDGNKDIWITSSAGQLICHEAATRKTFTFLADLFPAAGAGDELYDLVRHGRRLYLFYRSGLVRCFDRSTGRELYRQELAVQNRRAYDRTLLVVPVNQYLYQVRNGNGGQLLRFDTATRKTTILLETSYWLNSLAADTRGNSWLSCRDGLWCFTEKAASGTLLPEIPLADGKQIRNEISTVFYDRQGGLWIGLYNKGLYYYHPDRYLFQQFGKPAFGLPDNSELQVNCFTETADGTALAGTQNGLFAVTDPPGSAFKPVVPGLYCQALLTDRQGRTWIAAAQGLYCRSREGRIRHYLNEAVSSLYQDRSNHLYAGTGNRGLLRLNEQADTFYTVYTGEQLPDIRQLTGWQDGLLGLAANGLFNITGKGQLAVPAGDRNRYLPMFRRTENYTCLLQSRDGLLWMGTLNGLHVWDERRQQLYRLKKADGLANNSIKALVEDKEGFVWVTTARGISRVSTASASGGSGFRIVNYNSYDGLIEHGFRERSAFAGTGLYFGGVDGMNLYHPQLPSSAAGTPLQPVLQRFKLFGKPMESENALAGTDTIHLKHDQNFFSISFSGLNYINPAQTSYRYRLEGVDRNWRTDNPASGIGEAGYTQLAAGIYRFQVQAATPVLPWGPARNLIIIIHPPIWNTGAARAVYLLVALLGAYVAGRYLLKRSKARRLQQQAQAIEEAKAAFLTNISHDLRTPLTLIITPLKSLAAQVADPQVKNSLLRINTHADLLLDIINQLLDYKKTETGAESLHLQYLDQLVFLEQLCLAYAPVAAEKEILFTTEIPSGSVGLWLDRQKVARIVTNLLSNAFKYTPKGGSVTLKASLHGTENQLLLSVTDTGIGMAPAELNRVFDRFYRAARQEDGTTGSGIGLYLVKHYAALHGGSVAVESQPGAGSCFRVTLAAAAPAAPPPELPAAGAHPTLLIIEDHPAFRTYLATELQPAYRILTAGNGKEGLEKALECEPDIVVTDMMMPEMNGADFCLALRSQASIAHLPVIMLTARTSDAARLEGYAAGADAYLVKPFDIELLRLRLRNLLQLRETRKQQFAQGNGVNVEALTTNPLDKALLERAVGCVEKNLDNSGYSVEKFSADMFMDRTGLYRKLVALTGQAPAHFIRSIRLKKAAVLLASRQLTITEIAGEVGFNSVSYFSKCFHELFGKTPTQYIEHQQQSPSFDSESSPV